MFEIACKVANKSGKALTIEISIPEEEKPDVQILMSECEISVFASPTRSTVKITVVSVEDADRIEKLEAALREITWIATPDHEEARHKATEIARKALEGES